MYFHRCFGIRRFAWNYGVERWGNYKSWTKLDKIWNCDSDLKINKPYLYDVNSMIKNMAFKELNKAWQKVYKKQGNKPRFKSKKKDSNRFSMFEKTRNQKTKTIMFNNKRINLNATRRLGRFNIKCAENLNFLNDESIRVAEWTISERSGSYYISIIYERTNYKPIEVNKPLDKVGIDSGIKTLLTCYNGNHFSELYLPDKIIGLEKQIDYLQKKQSKREYNSMRYKSVAKKIDKLYVKINNIKKDFMYKQAVYLAKTYKIINFESFNFNGAKVINKGRRKLYRIAINSFTEILKNKCSEYNTILNIIKDKPTTQTCSKCGHRYYNEEKLTLSDRVFVCNSCGNILGRDKNSAINIYNSI